MKKIRAVGCLFYCLETKNICLDLRNSNTYEPNSYSTWGGVIENGEKVRDALIREIKEEMNIDLNQIMVDIYPIYKYSDIQLTYYNYLVTVKKEFKPTISDESKNYLWTKINELPFNLHPKFIKAIPYFENKLSNLNEADLLIYTDTVQDNLFEASREAKSKAQRRLMAMAYLYKHGRLGEKFASAEVKELSKLDDSFLKAKASTDQKKKRKDGSVGKRNNIPYKVKK